MDLWGILKSRPNRCNLLKFQIVAVDGAEMAAEWQREEEEEELKKKKEEEKEEEEEEEEEEEKEVPILLSLIHCLVRCYAAPEYSELILFVLF